MKKESYDNENTNDENARQSYDNVDLNHVYIETDLKFNKWNDGKHFVQEVSNTLFVQNWNT